MAGLRALWAFLKRHPRALAVAQVSLFALFLGFAGWALHGALRDAGDRLREADPIYFVLGCAMVAAYYLLFVVGWIWILGAWGISITYPIALRAEMVSMLAKYVPGGIWTPAARVIAARRAGITQGGLVTASILIEAGLSALSGVVVFVVSLAWVREVDAPLAPLLAFAAIVAVLLHPRIFQPVAAKALRRFGCSEVPAVPARTMLLLLGYYCFTWLVGGCGLYFLLRSLEGHPPLATIPFLGGVSAVGAIVAVLAVFAPSGLGVREGSMYGLLLAVTANEQGVALGATLLNRVAITVVEILLLVVGGFILRGRHDEARLVTREGET